VCSLLGIVSRKKSLSPEIEAAFEPMLEASKNRGPDDTCIKKFGDNVIFGSNRLTIVDLSNNGRIPMPDEDERYWVIYNGEIYNYKELRLELEQKGYHFKSTSDTEVVVNGYKEWGRETLSKFNGEFAFAIWDTKEQELFIARDRFGIKPLYYMETPDYLILSSDFRAFLRFPGFEREIDLEALTSYMYLRYVTGSKSILKGIKKVLPAESICWNLKKRTRASKIFWKPNFVPITASESEISMTLHDKVRDAVEHSLTGDVDVGVLLSGGLDSSAIVGMMSKLGKKPIKTFSCSYKQTNAESVEIGRKKTFSLVDTVEDESYYSDIVAKKFKTNHVVIQIQEDDVENHFSQMVYEMGEPMASTDALGHYLLGRELKKYVKVAVTGLGGDELFGGYIELFFGKNGRQLTEKVDAAEYLRLYSTIGGELDAGKYLKKKYVKKGYFKKYVSQVISKFPIKKYPKEKVNEFMFFLLFVDLVGWELEQSDRIYMASSIESRPVFLENGLADYAISILSKLKFTKNGNEKYILKKALAEVLPSEIVNRKKFPGLGTPRKWYSKPWFNKRLKELKKNPLEIWDKRALNQLLSGKMSDAKLEVLYRIILFEEWYKIFLSKDKRI